MSATDTATASKPVVLPDPQPENAKQAVLMVRDDHNWIEARADLNSTDGIRRNITALWAAIDRLAAYVDGDKTDRRPDRIADRPAFTPKPAPVTPSAPSPVIE